MKENLKKSRYERLHQCRIFYLLQIVWILNYIMRLWLQIILLYAVPIPKIRQRENMLIQCNSTHYDLEIINILTARVMTDTLTGNLDHL